MFRKFTNIFSWSIKIVGLHKDGPIIFCLGINKGFKNPPNFKHSFASIILEIIVETKKKSISTKSKFDLVKSIVP